MVRYKSSPIGQRRKDGHSPLSEGKAFTEFTEHIGERCEEAPVATELREIGSFPLFGASREP